MRNPEKERPNGRSSGRRKTIGLGRSHRVPSSADDGIKSNNVISGGVYLGNDTSHDRQGDFFARNRVLSVMQSFCRKRPLAFFDTVRDPHALSEMPVCLRT